MILTLVPQALRLSYTNARVTMVKPFTKESHGQGSAEKTRCGANEEAVARCFPPFALNAYVSPQNRVLLTFSGCALWREKTMEFVLKEARISLRETQHLPKIEQDPVLARRGSSTLTSSAYSPPASAFPWLTQSEAESLAFCP